MMVSLARWSGRHARSRGKADSNFAGMIENQGSDRQSEANGIDDIERKDGGTVTGYARIERKAGQPASEQPAIDRAHDDERGLPGKQSQERRGANDSDGTEDARIMRHDFGDPAGTDK